ncbi:hypothetical protein [Beduinella massiliensis]|uniref:hypothetical protein n=1 Tax=Beduinella massiliensis TaxID=1852363 RepID=UPI0031F88EF5
MAKISFRFFYFHAVASAQKSGKAGPLYRDFPFSGRFWSFFDILKRPLFSFWAM